MDEYGITQNSNPNKEKKTKKKSSSSNNNEIIIITKKFVCLTHSDTVANFVVFFFGFIAIFLYIFSFILISFRKCKSHK